MAWPGKRAEDRTSRERDGAEERGPEETGNDSASNKCNRNADGGRRDRTDSTMVSRAAAKKERESAAGSEASEDAPAAEEASGAGKAEEEGADSKAKEDEPRSEEDKRTMEAYSELRRELNMDKATCDAAWKSYEAIRQKYTLEVREPAHVPPQRRLNRVFFF